MGDLRRPALKFLSSAPALGNRRPSISPLLLKRLSDEQLSRRLAAGVTSAFDELYRRYSQRLATYAGQLIDDQVAGEDVAQAALLKALQAIQRGSHPDRVRPWLYRIAHNSAMDYVSSRRDTSRPTDEMQLSVVEDSGMRSALIGALEKLPERQRHVYLLREVHGLKMAEIGQALALAPQQVEQAMFSARNRLAELLVFGERLTCDTVQLLKDTALGEAERRAVRSHVRSCRECRATVSRARLSMLFLPLPFFKVREAKAASKVTAKLGGIPAPAAKVAIFVAAGGLALGTPVTAQVVRDRADEEFSLQAALDSAGESNSTATHSGGRLLAAATLGRIGPDSEDDTGAEDALEDERPNSSGVSNEANDHSSGPTDGSGIPDAPGSPGVAAPGEGPDQIGGEPNEASAPTDENLDDDSAGNGDDSDGPPKDSEAPDGTFSPGTDADIATEPENPAPKSDGDSTNSGDDSSDDGHPSDPEAGGGGESGGSPGDSEKKSEDGDSATDRNTDDARPGDRGNHEGDRGDVRGRGDHDREQREKKNRPGNKQDHHHQDDERDGDDDDDA